MPRHRAPQGALGRRLTSRSISRAAVRFGQPAVHALHRDWPLVTFLTAASASALAAAIATRAILAGASGRSPLSLAPVPDTDIGIAWSDLARGVATSRQQSLVAMLDSIALIGIGAVVVGLISVVALSWARASRRREEIAIRRSVGASRRAVASSALLEGVAMLVPALVGGLTAGWLAARALLKAWPDALLAWRVETWLAALGSLLLMGGGSLFVFRFARGRRIEGLPSGALGLIPQVLQMAGTLAVLGAATSLSNQAMRLLETSHARADATRYRLDASMLAPEARAARYATLLAGLAANPAVEAASINTPGLATGLGQADWIETECGQCRSAGIVLQWHSVEAAHHVISPDTFTVLGLPLIEGRTFTNDDGWDAPRVVVVNRNLALRHFQDGQPIGRKLYIGSWSNRVAYTVVGVVDDRQAPVLGSGAQPRDAVYLSVFQHPPTTGELLVRGGVIAPARLASTDLTFVAEPSLGAVRRHESALLAWFAMILRLEGLLALVSAFVGAAVAMRLWSHAMQGELALRRAVGAPRWRLLLRVIATVIAVVAIAALSARLFVTPSLAWLVAALLRDAAPQVMVAWMPVALLTVAALAGALPPLVEVLRRPPARWLS